MLLNFFMMDDSNAQLIFIKKKNARLITSLVRAFTLA